MSAERPASATPVNNRVVDDFLIAHGGPFYELQSRLRLLHRHNLARGRRAVLFAHPRLRARDSQGHMDRLNKWRTID